VAAKLNLVLAITLGSVFCISLTAGQYEGRGQPWQHSYIGLPNVVGEAGGVPIYAYGSVYIYGVSPDFESRLIIQHSAPGPQKKVKPKKSWEMGENHLGSMVSYQPREPRNDIQPILPVNLIDGDANTFWMTRGEAQPDVMPAWIRVDLAREERLRLANNKKELADFLKRASGDSALI
jgi:hypothetical protein